MTEWRPRRQNARWLDGDCPAEVLAIYDNGGKTFDRYTILYVPTLEQRKREYLDYLGSSVHPFDPQGFGQHGELTRWDAQAFRYREAPTKWTALPADVQKAVRQDCDAIRPFLTTTNRKEN